MLLVECTYSAHVYTSLNTQESEEAFVNVENEVGVHLQLHGSFLTLAFSEHQQNTIKWFNPEKFKVVAINRLDRQ